MEKPLKMGVLLAFVLYSTKLDMNERYDMKAVFQALILWTVKSKIEKIIVKNSWKFRSLFFYY